MATSLQRLLHPPLPPTPLGNASPANMAFSSQTRLNQHPSANTTRPAHMARSAHQPELEEVWRHRGHDEQTIQQGEDQEEQKKLVVGEPHAVVQPEGKKDSGANMQWSFTPKIRPCLHMQIFFFKKIFHLFAYKHDVYKKTPSL